MHPDGVSNMSLFDDLLRKEKEASEYFKELDPIEPEKVKETLDKFKFLWPLALLPLLTLLRKKAKNGELSESIDLVAVSNLLVGYSDVITALVWVMLSRVSKTVHDLSFVIIGAELLPSIDLNVPKGVVLGSAFVGSVPVLGPAGDVIDWMLQVVRDTSADVGDLIETGQTTETTGPLDIFIASLLEVTGLVK